ncbi:MAG: aspartate carbamoyltransferase [Patescibacteria group bacterium]|nr:aspartate carbamoyltransferase [Patescibacteria group bacterium]
MAKNISPYKHVINSQQFDEKFIKKFFELTDYMKKHENEVEGELKHKIVSLLFYQPSTRTRFSFEAAAKLLGACTLMTESAELFSSVSKGESLEDTIKIVNGYSDFIVLRHKENDSSDRAASVSKVPIINAGSGTGQHPTQALLDLYTIYNNFKRTRNLKIAVVGDLARGRTVNSLVYLLSRYDGNEFYFVAPENCRIKEGITEHLDENHIRYIETTDLNSVLKKVDVVYMTRIQKEYFDDLEEYQKAKGIFVINKANIKLMKKDAILMHPLPRVDEIAPEVDSDPRAKYFEQARNGLNVRMAILKMLNDNNKK